MSNEDPDRDYREYWLCPVCKHIAPWGGACTGTEEDPHPEAELVELRPA